MPKRRVKQVSWAVESERAPEKQNFWRRLEKGRLKSSELALVRMSKAVTEEEVFYAVAGAAYGAFDLQRYSEARELANKAIEISPSFQDNWNYGNATFAGHTVLGLLALREGNIEQAVAELQQSATTTGSPQLASFGPTMRLAKELLIQGRTEEVIAFLHHCLTFWKMGSEWVAVWEKKIKRGAIPNFLMNLYP